MTATVGVQAMKRSTALRVMVVGSMPPPVGGTTVSLRQLCDFLATSTESCIVVDSSPRQSGMARALVRTARQLWRDRREVDVVSLHFSDRAAITAGPLLWLLCRFAGKPVIYRQFGGEFARTFFALPAALRWWLQHTILRSDALLMQTKSMVECFSRISPNVHWFPTARESTSLRCQLHFAVDPTRPLRCVFVGHVRRAKGVLTAVEAVNRVARATLDIYGPLVDVDEAELTGPGIRYRSALAPANVQPTMIDYDLLLFPSRYPGEGYPGTLVESAMVGLPIVVSRWQALPEMFTEDEAIFVDAGSVEQLASEIQRIADHPALLRARSEALLRRARDFDAVTVFGRFVRICNEMRSTRVVNNARRV